ncbi:MAG: rod shape-determining protein MreC [Deltaproteobacteria bacterium]|nr:rod shape-determining protein MreC [Deltaproteobacteria bacterium]
MNSLSRRLPLLLSSALIFIFFTLCVSFGLQKGGNLLSIVERAALTMVYPLQKGIDLGFSSCGKLFDDYINLVGIKARNKQLEEDLAKARYRLAELAEIERENLRLHKLLLLKQRDSLLEQGLAAHVIGRQTDNFSHILIIDRGSRQGLNLNNPVFTPEGLVGRIVACAPLSAKVLLLLDQNSACDVIVQRNRVRGILQGAGHLCRLAHLQNSADVKIGDLLMTSGLDNIFPKGMTVGTVISTNRNENDLSQEIIVKPEFDLDAIEEVYIVPSSSPAE